VTKLEARRILRRAFGALTDAQRERLAYHLERGTPILCGETADLYADGAGGG